MMYYIFSLAILISGGIMLDIIYKEYPKSRIKNFIFWTTLILTIMSSLAIILEKFNICLILLGIFECINTYKYRKKENVSIFNPFFADTYIFGYGLILWGIVKGFSNGFFW